MKKLVAVSMLSLLCVIFLAAPKAATSISDEAQIRQLMDRYSRAFAARDIDGIMTIYAPGEAVIAFDIVPPLQVKGQKNYRKNWEAFLAAYKGPIQSEMRELTIVTGDRVAYSHNLEKYSGTLQSGDKSEFWMRVTDGYRKINGKWLITHEHISVPADFETGKAVLDAKP